MMYYVIRHMDTIEYKLGQMLDDSILRYRFGRIDVFATFYTQVNKEFYKKLQKRKKNGMSYRELNEIMYTRIL